MDDRQPSFRMLVSLFTLRVLHGKLADIRTAVIPLMTPRGIEHQLIVRNEMIVVVVNRAPG